MAGNLTDRWEEEGPVVSADKECSATYIYLGRPPIPVRIQRVFLLTRESSTLGEGLASDDGKVIGRDSRDWRERTRMKNGEWRVNQHWRTRRKLKHRYQEKLKSYKWIDFSLLMKSKEEGRKEVRKEVWYRGIFEEENQPLCIIFVGEIHGGKMVVICSREIDSQTGEKLLTAILFVFFQALPMNCAYEFCLAR